MVIIGTVIIGEFGVSLLYDAELETYSDYWQNKIRGNIERDIKVNEHYKSLGWTVLRFWQSDLEKDVTACIIKGTSGNSG
jgi:hypothetical protein